MVIYFFFPKGWSIAESILTRLAPLWFGAREIEFKWDYLIMASEGTASLIYFIGFASFAWLWTRNDLSSSLLPTSIAFLIGFCYVSNIYRYFFSFLIIFLQIFIHQLRIQIFPIRFKF